MQSFQELCSNKELREKWEEFLYHTNCYFNAALDYAESHSLDKADAYLIALAMMYSKNPNRSIRNDKTI